MSSQYGISSYRYCLLMFWDKWCTTRGSYFHSCACDYPRRMGNHRSLEILHRRTSYACATDSSQIEVPGWNLQDERCKASVNELQHIVLNTRNWIYLLMIYHVIVTASVTPARCLCFLAVSPRLLVLVSCCCKRTLQSIYFELARWNERSPALSG